VVWNTICGVPETELYERALGEVHARDFADLTDDVAGLPAERGMTLMDEEAAHVATSELRSV
jgi:hypothetical protein